MSPASAAWTSRSAALVVSMRMRPLSGSASATTRTPSRSAMRVALAGRPSPCRAIAPWAGWKSSCPAKRSRRA